MSERWEERLQNLAPRGAPVALREQVLAGVARELANQRARRWSRFAAAAIAAGVLFGVALNWGLDRAQEARVAAICGNVAHQRKAQLVRTTYGNSLRASWLPGNWGRSPSWYVLPPGEP